MTPTPTRLVQVVSVGTNSTCALASNRLWCWGENGKGQLGNKSNVDVRDAAVAVNVLRSDGSELPGPIKQFSVGMGYNPSTGGGYHSCAIDATNQLWCWGNNALGQLGNGTNTISNYAQLVKKNATTTLTNVTEVDVGLEHTCAIASGFVYCWGASWFGETGQPGNGPPNYDLDPIVVNDSSGQPFTGASNISVGQRTSCVIKSGNVWCWGVNREGELGNGSSVGSSTIPVRVIKSDNTALTDVNLLSVGMFHICAKTTANTVWCWGMNNAGQLGNGNLTNQYRAVQVLKSGSVPLTAVLDISSGDEHTCARLSTGVWCWGNNVNGQLGDGTTKQSSIPVQVKLMSGAVLANVTGMSAGSAYNCAVANSKALCWGKNLSGQLGDGTVIDKLKAFINGL